ncbi:MAG: TonB-dependent receptor [Nitrosomonas sp.]|nr:TonB-dependent receptor [Nitrosomonas sp.]
MNLEELMNIEVITASKHPQRLTEVPSAVFVITQEDIRRSGATSIPEALRMAPGVQVARVGTDKWSISVRGFNGRFANKLQVLMDGRSVYTPLFSGVIWSQQDTFIEDIERIEVIRGPGATVWGVNAMNGVINIITKKAADTQGTMLTAGGGSFERGFVGARYGGKLNEDTPFRIYAKGFSRDNTTTLAGANAHDTWHSARAGFRLDHTRGIDEFTLQGDMFINSIGDSLHHPTLTPPFTRLDTVNSKEKGGNIRFRWDRHHSAQSSTMLQIYYDRIHSQLAPSTRYAESFDVDFRHRLPLFAQHDVIWGGNFRFYNNKVSNTALTRFTPSQRGNHFISAFVRDEITLLPDHLRLTLGVRLGHNDFTGFEIQPDARLMWTPDKQNSVWMSVARAVRTPSRGEDDVTINSRVAPTLSGFSTPPPILMAVQGTHNYGSEKLIAYELGYRHQFTSSVSIDIAGFFNDYSHLRDFSFGTIQAGPGPIPHQILPIFFNNQASAHAYGGEVSVDWRVIERWRLQGNYSYQEVNVDASSLSDQIDSTTGGANKANPHHQVSLRSNYDLSDRLEFNLWLRYVSSLPFYGIQDYVTMDAKMAWKPVQDVEFFLVGQNLFTQNHRESQSDFIPSIATRIPRGIYVGGRWHF